jgi:hypothetical protein
MQILLEIIEMMEILSDCIFIIHHSAFIIFGQTGMSALPILNPKSQNPSFSRSSLRPCVLVP